eukprot:1278359-Lingulodinium_polyedra.AAC.1
MERTHGSDRKEERTNARACMELTGKRSAQLQAFHTRSRAQHAVHDEDAPLKFMGFRKRSLARRFTSSCFSAPVAMKNELAL